MSGHLEDRLKELTGLPALSPPDTLEERALAAMAEAAAPRRTFAPARAAVWIAVAGVSVVLGALVLEVEPGSGSGAESRAGTGPGAGAGAETVASNLTAETPTERTPAAPPETTDDTVYTELAAEAEYLEQLLAAMPQRSVMRVSTAGTIAGLEDQIALIDAELERAASPRYRTLLMHNRVEVMNALVNVRYSQSTAFTY